MTAQAALFQLHQPKLGYQGQTVLTGLNLAIAQGEKVALLGQSGTGKSTLLRQLRSQQAQQVAWCPQKADLVPMLSAFHNIYMGRLDQHPFWYNLANLVRPLASPRAEIQALAQELGLGHRLWQPVQQLSGGQQGRISLGRALYQHKPVFLGDEPVAALDESQADQLLALICQRHQTVILALHDVEQALRHCSRIIGLKDGHVVMDGASGDFTCQQLLTLYA